MYVPLPAGPENAVETVCGIPFVSSKENLPRVFPTDVRCHALSFLGMCVDGDQMCDWWGQDEVNGDYSSRIFIGDRIGRILIIYDDFTQDLIPLIFGVNVWNYNLYYGPKPGEDMMAFAAPYTLPFSEDAKAKALLDRSLHLCENTADSARHGTKFVFTVRCKPHKTVKTLEFRVERYKKASVLITAATALTEACDVTDGLRATDYLFYLRREWFRDADKLARRLYQFRDEIPTHDERLVIDGFDAPDIIFEGNGLADIFTNIYRYNITDMFRGKIAPDGLPRTSTPSTPDYGCYIGFGTYTIGGADYSDWVWSRDCGRNLFELVRFGYGDRLLTTADKVHTLLYQYAIRYKLPHWKRIANIVPKDDNDIHNEGKENDGHCALMCFIAALYQKGVVDTAWLKENEQPLRDAAGFLLWQIDNPERSDFIGVLRTESECTTQIYGGYDLFSNSYAVSALLGYAEMFDTLDADYAGKLRHAAETLRKGCRDTFMFDHPRYGRIFCDINDDCWTYPYKRFAPAFHACDTRGYDLSRIDPQLFCEMRATFAANREEYYHPMSGRQMGYGQAYLTQATLALDLFDELTDCVEATAMLTYHHSDWKYMVPEGVVINGNHTAWFRNCDLGNGVQQSETVKTARLMVGIDDLDRRRGVEIIPRLPLSWNRLCVRDYPVVGGTVGYDYRRHKGVVAAGKGETAVTDGNTTYTVTLDATVPISLFRVGPFDTDHITCATHELTVRRIGERWFGYIKKP